MSPATMVAVFGILLPALGAAAGGIVWLVKLGQGIGRIEQKIDRLSGIEMLLLDARDRLARLEGSHGAPKANGIAAH